MTLNELWEKFGERYGDYPVMFDPNGDGALPVRDAIDFTMDDGEAVLLLTNCEEADGGWNP